jgi:hypothetical protein
MNQRRMIHTSLWEDEDFAQLSDAAKILFIGMFSLADDFGRIKANCRYLKSSIFMYDDTKSLESIVILRDEISRVKKSISFYIVDGKEYAQFLNWEKHQSIRSDRKKPSEFPSPQDGNQMTTKCQPNDNQPRQNDRVIEEKGKEKNISAAKASEHSKKLQTPTEVQRIVAYLERVTGAKITNFGKQSKFWKAMHDAGYTEKNVCFAIDDMWETEFWRNTGFDLKNVADQIAKIKQKYQAEDA